MQVYLAVAGGGRAVQGRVNLYHTPKIPRHAKYDMALGTVFPCDLWRQTRPVLSRSIANKLLTEKASSAVRDPQRCTRYLALCTNESICWLAPPGCFPHLCC